MKRFLFILISLIAISSYAQNWEYCKEGMQSSVYICYNARVPDFINYKFKKVDTSKIAVKFIITKDNIQLVTYGLDYPSYLYYIGRKYGTFKFVKQEGAAYYYEFKPEDEIYDEFYNSLDDILEDFKTYEDFHFGISTAPYGESDDYGFRYISSKEYFNELYNSFKK
jgi:hypothetical protein